MPVEELGIEFVVEGLGSFLVSVKKADDAVDDVGGTAEKTGSILDTALATALGQGIVSAANLAWDALIKVSGAIVGMVGDSIALESAYAGVIKTTDGLATEWGDLTQEGEILKGEFRDLAKAIPVDIEELMGIGELGGQLGIQRENLIGFTDSIAAMGEATNLTSEQAASGMAQFMNVMGTTQTEVGNLGSAIVYLGNNFATTESDVLNFGQRLAGAGAVVGLTEGDVLGIAAAFSSIGVSAEAGGTAVQKVLLDMNTQVATSGDKLDLFAMTAGMTADEFSAMWETDAAGAFANFVTGLGAAGDDATQILSDLGLEDQRLISSFLSLAQNSDILKQAIDGSNAAFEEGTALSEEAEARYRTTESQIQLLKNNFRDLGFTIGDAVLPAVTDFIVELIPLVEQYGPMLASVLEGVTPILEGLAAGFTGLFSSNPQGGIAEIAEVVGAAFGEETQQKFIAFTEFLKVAIPEAITFAQGVIQQFADFFVTLSPVIDGIVEAITVTWNALKDNASIIWDGIKLVVSGAIDFVLGFVTMIMGVLRGEWEVAWEGVKQIVDGAWQLISGIIETALGLILTLVGTNLTELTTTIAQLWVIVKTVTMQVWTAISTFLTDLWATIKTAATVAWNALKESVSTAVEGAKTAITDAFDAAVTYLMGIDLVSIGNDIIQGLISGITGAGAGVVAALGGIVDSAIAAAKSKLGIGSPSRLMAAEIGKPMGLGAAMGIAESEPIIQNEFVRAITPNVSSIAPLMLGARSTSNVYNNQRTSTTTQNFNLTPDLLIETVGMTASV